MKIADENLYSDWDSPKTFCQYQIDDEEGGLLCNDKIFDIERIGTELKETDEEFFKNCKCPFSESDIVSIGDVKVINDCPIFKYYKNNKNPNAQRIKKRDL